MLAQPQVSASRLSVHFLGCAQAATTHHSTRLASDSFKQASDAIGKHITDSSTGLPRPSWGQHASFGWALESPLLRLFHIAKGPDGMVGLYVDQLRRFVLKLDPCFDQHNDDP